MAKLVDIIKVDKLEHVVAKRENQDVQNFYDFFRVPLLDTVKK